jgi:hypothetical protein
LTGHCHARHLTLLLRPPRRSSSSLSRPCMRWMIRNETLDTGCRHSPWGTVREGMVNVWNSI